MFSQSEQRQLPYRMMVFHEVVRAGSFTAAAERLGHTKSAVSTYINQLETLLGVRLLKRSTRRLNLTEAGEVFARRCAAIASHQQQALLELDAMAEEPVGRLVITAPNLFANTLLPSVIAELCARYPALTPELIFTDERLDLLSHHIDLAISVGALVDSGYHAIALGKLSFVLVAAPSYLQQQPIECTDDLLTCSLIRLPWQEAALIHSGAESLPFQGARDFKVNTTTAAISCVGEGLGVALLSAAAVAQALSVGRLVQVLPEWHGGHTPVYAVHSYRDRLPTAIRFCSELLQDKIANLPTVSGYYVGGMEL
jgi:DNA-binding transcriptional LysR family regulator